MHSVQRGDISKALILADLVERGFRVLIPFSENCRYDLALDTTGKLIRIQCKTGRHLKGVVEFRVANTLHLSKKAKRRLYTAEEIDMFAVYCPQVRKIYYVPIEVCAGITSMMSLRVDPVRNGQNEGVRWAKDFEDLKF